MKPPLNDGKDKMETRGTKAMVAMEKTIENERSSNRERKMALIQDVDKLKRKLRLEENVHRVLERAFTRPLGSLPRLPPYLPPHASEQETTAHQTGTAIINPRRGVAKEKPLFYSSLKDKQSLEKKMAKFITTVKKSVIKQELDDVYADHLKLQKELLSSSSSLDDKESEDIVKCLCRIFMRIVLHLHAERKCDPYGIFSESEVRDIGAYNSLCESKASNVDIDQTGSVVFQIHRLKRYNILYICLLRKYSKNQKHCWLLGPLIELILAASHVEMSGSLSALLSGLLMTDLLKQCLHQLNACAVSGYNKSGWPAAKRNYN
ncbi:Ternary complex factor MIP1 [Vigna unguiculata]|uniref:Ternary complex factor MIP1 n=1 Tax=Vigna unguiculata TaxID=3917 RepID=A0A4D6LTM7_VIGUN|nr:Ternary complex factor MIP1 [Vigna unguiculata]